MNGPQTPSLSHLWAGTGRWDQLSRNQLNLHPDTEAPDLLPPPLSEAHTAFCVLPRDVVTLVCFFNFVLSLGLGVFSHKVH